MSRFVALNILKNLLEKQHQHQHQHQHQDQHQHQHQHRQHSPDDHGPINSYDVSNHAIDINDQVPFASFSHALYAIHFINGYSIH
jgi:hypothetical protein